MHKTVVLFVITALALATGERVPIAAPKEAIAGELNRKPFTARHAYLYWSRRFVFVVDGDATCKQMIPTDKIPDGTRYVLMLRIGERELQPPGFQQMQKGKDWRLPT